MKLFPLFQIIVASIAFGGLPTVSGQPLNPDPGVIFDDAGVPRIDIFLPEDSLLALYDDPWSNHEYKATFVFSYMGTMDTIADIGLRARGNFSRGADKKSFKVSFNTFHQGRKYLGLEKMNLNGQHNDPTVSRTKISLDLYHGMGVTAPRSNHVELWFNNNYFGLYINTEHIDEEFTEAHLGSNLGNLYKCTWPADLVWSGSTSSAYEYCAQTQQGDLPAYDRLIAFIDVLNNTPDADFRCQLEEVFDVYEWIKTAAVEVLIAHWDGYIYNKNNFYLYENPVSGKVSYLAYDVDNTHGIDWFGIDWTARDIYDWGNSDPRPLFDRMMQEERYRDQYSYYINKFLINLFDPLVYGPKMDDLELKITAAAEADIFRTLDYGYSIADFHNAFDGPLFGHVKAGIKSYNSDRYTEAAAQLDLNDIFPIVNHVRFNYPALNSPVQFRAFVEDDDAGVTVKLWYSADGSADSTDMFDDGLHNDLLAGDGVYGVELPAYIVPTNFSYQVYARDISGKLTQSPCSPASWIIDEPESALYINEFLAINDGSLTAPDGNASDWLEIYNAGAAPVYLGDKFLSDNPTYPSRWGMPDMLLGPGEFKLFWADDDENQGTDHINFRLDGNGGFIGIFDSEAEQLRPLHQVQYGMQTADVSMGLLPDGSGEVMVLGNLTPGWSNLLTGSAEVPSASVSVYPNPASDRIFIMGEIPPDAIWSVQTLDGKSFKLEAPNFNKLIQLPDLSSGLYFLKIENRNSHVTIPISVIR